MSESKIQSQMIKYIKARGGKVIDTIVLSTSGNADLIVCYLGRYVEIEAKAAGKKARALQEVKGRETIKAGGKWICTSSIEDVVDLLDNIDREIREKQ